MSRIHILDLWPVWVTGTWISLLNPHTFLCLMEIIKLICRFVVRLKGSRSKVPSQATGRGILGRWRGSSFRGGDRELFHKWLLLVSLLFIFIWRKKKKCDFHTVAEQTELWLSFRTVHVCSFEMSGTLQMIISFPPFTYHGNIFKCYARSLGKSTWGCQPRDTDVVLKVTHS